MTFRAVLVLSLFVSSPAGAHVAGTGSEGFFTGLVQPLLEIQVGIAAAAVGLFLGQRKDDLTERAASLFLVGAFIGLCVAFLSERPSLPVYGIYAVSLVAGLLIAAAHPVNRWLSVPVGLAGGLVLGIGSGPEPASAAAIAFTTGGSFITIALVFVYGIIGANWLVTRERYPWLAIALRVLGSWIFAVSLLVAALSFRI